LWSVSRSAWLGPVLRLPDPVVSLPTDTLLAFPFLVLAVGWAIPARPR
jgi:hypothetical protein